MEIALERLPRESIAASSLPSVISEILFIVFTLVVVLYASIIQLSAILSSLLASIVKNFDNFFLAIGWKVKSENRKCFHECRLNVAVDDLVCDFLVSHVVCLSCCCLLYVSIIYISATLSTPYS